MYLIACIYLYRNALLTILQTWHVLVESSFDTYSFQTSNGFYSLQKKAADNTSKPHDFKNTMQFLTTSACSKVLKEAFLFSFFVVLVLGVTSWAKNVPHRTENVRKQKLFQIEQKMKIVLCGFVRPESRTVFWGLL